MSLVKIGQAAKHQVSGAVYRESIESRLRPDTEGSRGGRELLCGKLALAMAKATPDDGRPMPASEQMAGEESDNDEDGKRLSSSLDHLVRSC